jgi:MoxR-like ATPase
VRRQGPAMSWVALPALVSCQLPQPFIVLATDNPIGYEGAYPLPEAQLDRFKALSLQPGGSNVQFTYVDQVALPRWERVIAQLAATDTPAGGRQAGGFGGD